MADAPRCAPRCAPPPDARKLLEMLAHESAAALPAAQRELVERFARGHCAHRLA